MTDITQQPKTEYDRRSALYTLSSIDGDIRRLEAMRLRQIKECLKKKCTWDEISVALSLKNRQVAWRKYRDRVGDIGK